MKWNGEALQLYSQKLAMRKKTATTTRPTYKLISYHWQTKTFLFHTQTSSVFKSYFLWDLQYYYFSSQQAHIICIFVFILVGLESVSQSLLRRGRLQIACKCSSVFSVDTFSESRLIVSAIWQFYEVCMCFVRLWDLSLDTYARSAAIIQFVTCMVNKSAPAAKEHYWVIII